MKQYQDHNELADQGKVEPKAKQPTTTRTGPHYYHLNEKTHETIRGVNKWRIPFQQVRRLPR